MRRQALFGAGLIAVALFFSCSGGPAPRKGPPIQPDRAQKPAPSSAPFKPAAPAAPAPALSARDRIEAFASGGFGFAYRDDERASMSRFLARHGRPSAREDKQIKNRYDGLLDAESRLVYKKFEAKFYNFSPRKAWKAPESLLEAIWSVDGAEYLYGIREGSSRAEILALFGLADSGGGSVEIRNAEGNYVTFVFKAGMLDRIIWEFSRE
jgi:hypothetical protein